MTVKPLAVTLVHKGAMEIAVPSVSSFARHFGGRFRLEIHTDGTLGEQDEDNLLIAADGLDARIVRPTERKWILEERISPYPRTRSLLDGVGYNAKLELPMVISPPYFYFDSDIVWLRPVENLVPAETANAFSTESWTWYNGVAKAGEWVKMGIPRRVNSGFHYLSEPFPFARMEELLAKRLFDPAIKYNTDQEIMAYLFPRMSMYHPDDFKRSRRNIRYDLAKDSAAAIHFPGGMWKDHLDQMQVLEVHLGRETIKMRYETPIALTHAELWKMRLRVMVSDSPILGRLINSLRALLRK